MPSLVVIFSLLPVLLYILYKPILRLLTPQGIPGIPAYPDSKPFLGDIKRFAKGIKEYGGPGAVFDKTAKDLGPIAQIRISFLAK
jgi:hypothetical protein